MRQLLQQIDSGATVVREVPAPLCGPREVLVANVVRAWKDTSRVIGFTPDTSITGYDKLDQGAAYFSLANDTNND